MLLHVVPVAVWTEPWNILLVGNEVVTATARSGAASADELRWDGVCGDSFMTTAVVAHNHKDTHCAFAFWVIDRREQSLEEIGGWVVCLSESAQLRPWGMKIGGLECMSFQICLIGRAVEDCKYSSTNKDTMGFIVNEEKEQAAEDCKYFSTNQ